MKTLFLEEDSMKKQLRKISSIVLSATLTAAMAAQMPFSASAASATFENYTARFTYSIKNGTAEISNVSPRNVKNGAGETIIEVPTYIRNYPVVLGTYSFYRISTPISVSSLEAIEIKDKAFFVCSGLKEISLRERCRKVNTNAFYDCDNLKTVTFRGSNNAVNDNSSLTIESYAFNDCSKLNSLNFGCRDDIIIKPNAFYGCMSLKNFNKDNASADHSSLYVQAGAFNGTGIVNNRKAVVPASKVESLIPACRNSYNQKMVGKVLIVDLVTQTPDTPYYNAAEPSRIAAYNSTLLEQEAAKYGVNLDIINATGYVYTNTNALDVARDPGFVDRPEVMYGLKSSFPFLSTCNSLDEAVYRLKMYYGASEVSFVFDVNADNVCSTWTGGQHEFSVVYQRCSAGYNHSTVWMHEVAHAFGAYDAYRGNYNYVNTYLTEDIMNYNLENVGWLAACQLGWTDTALSDDVTGVFGNVSLYSAKASKTAAGKNTIKNTPRTK